MKILNFILAILIGTSLVGCNKNKTINARIYERKHLEGDSLQIKYRYNVDQKEFVDSAVVENKVIPDDAINVTIDKNDPTQTVYKADK